MKYINNKSVKYIIIVICILCGIGYWLKPTKINTDNIAKYVSENYFTQKEMSFYAFDKNGDSLDGNNFYININYFYNKNKEDIISNNIRNIWIEGEAGKVLTWDISELNYNRLKQFSFSSKYKGFNLKIEGEYKKSADIKKVFIQFKDGSILNVDVGIVMLRRNKKFVNPEKLNLSLGFSGPPGYVINNEDNLINSMPEFFYHYYTTVDFSEGSYKVKEIIVNKENFSYERNRVDYKEYSEQYKDCYEILPRSKELVVSTIRPFLIIELKGREYKIIPESYPGELYYNDNLINRIKSENEGKNLRIVE